jgi:cobalamin biosynthesis protein CobD/CbiB
MKFAAAILVFVLFALFLSWGVIEMLKGQPWLLLAAVGLFVGTFIKFGCVSQGE